MEPYNINPIPDIPSVSQSTNMRQDSAQYHSRVRPNLEQDAALQGIVVEETCSLCRHNFRVQITYEAQAIPDLCPSCRSHPPKIHQPRQEKEEAKSPQVNPSFECICGGLSPTEMLYCGCSICLPCYKAFILQRAAFPSFNVLDFNCPQCLEGISESKVYWLFGGQANFMSVFSVAQANEEVSEYDLMSSSYSKPCPKCTLLVENQSRSKNKECPSCSTSFCWVCGTIKSSVLGILHSCRMSDKTLDKSGDIASVQGALSKLINACNRTN
mmetsp:Transcript_32182/g.55590  ORF Transcript_32182/g.55590 Transcript_32182/m.55590 type:complete len:270 (+) Transcript_32182:184-993(+)